MLKNTHPEFYLSVTIFKFNHNSHERFVSIKFWSERLKNIIDIWASRGKDEKGRQRREGEEYYNRVSE